MNDNNIGVTGGIGTGKSIVSQELFKRLSEKFAIKLFNADIESRRLTNEDEQVRGEMKAVFGERIFDSEKNLNRALLRKWVFGDSVARKKLENILHPKIREAWMQDRKKEEWMLAEIPLLFETQAEKYFKLVVVTACSLESQMKRLTQVRKLNKIEANQIIETQMNTQEKILKADKVIWTDCSFEKTVNQIDVLASDIIERYGRDSKDSRKTSDSN